MSEQRIVIGVTYPSDLFRYAAEVKVFTSKLSDTPAILRQLWSDSLDLGFGIRSRKTDRVVYFTLKKVEKNDEGDYLRWIFEIYNPNLDPRLNGLSVIIYNDYTPQS